MKGVIIQMLKITIEIKENKDGKSSNVKIINPKDTSKATDGEKNCCAMVLNQIEKAFNEIKD